MRVFLSGICLWCIVLFQGHNACGSNVPLAHGGVINATHWDFDETALALNGYWIFFQDQLLTPGECLTKKGETVLFPMLWNDISASAGGTGFGTYSLIIIVPHSLQSLALEVPQVYCNYSLYVNGQRIANNGKVGTTKQQSTPEWRPQTVNFHIDTDTIHLVLQISNYHHFKGGIKDPIFLGKVEKLQTHRSVSIVSNFILSTILFIKCIVFIVMFFVRGRQRVTIYFAMLCLTWAVRTLFSNLYPVTILFPDISWIWLVRIEYFTLYLTSIFAVLFLNLLFYTIGNQMAKYLLVSVNLFFLVFTLTASPVEFTRWLSVYLSFSGLALIYGIIVVAKAILNEHSGVWFLVTGIILGIITFTYDMLSYKGLISYNPIVFSAAYLIMFMFITVSVLFHLDIIEPKRKSPGTMLRYDDLFKYDRMRL